MRLSYHYSNGGFYADALQAVVQFDYYEPDMVSLHVDMSCLEKH